MTLDTSEKDLETTIETALLLGGPDDPTPPGEQRHLRESFDAGDFIPGFYHRRAGADYDRALCLIPRDVLGFIYATQPKEWEKFKKAHAGNDPHQRLLARLSSEIGKRGALDVLRKGIKCDGSRFKLAYFQPASGLNDAIQKLYAANIFSVARQLHYSQRGNQSLDLALFLNGIPLFTAELKNPFKGQSVQDAIRQYRTGRDPKEPLFAFGRCLAHFAVDPDLVYVTTHLRGPDTLFLPFNQGRNNGAGNPPSWRGFSTAYLWEQIWARDSVLDLVQNFAQVVELDDERGRKTGERRLIFPRYHQLDAVRRLIADARAKGPGQRYLVQHSAGSGKSNSIAWLAHRLASLHDAQDRRVFSSIVVVTDRRVLDRQLQRTIGQFEQVEGVVENIDKTSRQLKQALEEGKTIIVTTLQKFPVIADQIAELPGRRFAVIVDEAHSSQGGESTQGLRKVLAPASLEAAEDEDEEEAPDELEARVLDAVRRRGPLPNVSYFAFTATPKAETMALFGTPRPDGSYAPFSLYAMRQAIEEGFILDVLQNYTTYKTYWSLLKKIAGDPRYERQRATALLKSFVDLHEHAINRKVEIMVEHFESQVRERIGGQAKAMIVTRSRLHAVRYKLAVDRSLRERGLPYKALVAFSDAVTDPADVERYTESGMNTASTGRAIPENATAEAFRADEFRLLIVANKFQTGFDQPLLHTMYVDKKLGGVNAVQTLSRLNRIHPGKDETMVLDFANEADDIQKAFQPYYDRTVLPRTTDPNELYDLETRLQASGFFAGEDVERFARIFFADKPTQDRLYAALQPVVDRYNAAGEDDRVEFRGALADYLRLYAFLSQILPFADADLLKLYEFARLLITRLPVARDRLPVEIQRQIEIESYRVHRTGTGRIPLERGQSELPVPRAAESHLPSAEEIEPLSAIIDELNERFGTDFTPEDRVFIAQLESRLDGDPGLEASVRVNPPEVARLTFDHVAGDRVQDLMDSNFKFFKQINDDPDFAKALFDWLFNRYQQRTKESGTRSAA